MDRLDTTNRVMAVIDDADAAARAVAALHRSGFAGDAVTLLRGADAATRIDAVGRHGGPWRRITRLVALAQADQSIDLATYEAALREGRSVIAVRVTSAGMAGALEILAEADAHFVNHFGRLVTEAVVPWRGETGVPSGS